MKAMRHETLLRSMDEEPNPPAPESREQRMARILAGDVARFVKPASALGFTIEAQHLAEQKARKHVPRS